MIEVAGGLVRTASGTVTGPRGVAWWVAGAIRAIDLATVAERPRAATIQDNSRRFEHGPRDRDSLMTSVVLRRREPCAWKVAAIEYGDAHRRLPPKIGLQRLSPASERADMFGGRSSTASRRRSARIAW